MDLCIVMPAYNEEGCIRAVVERWTSLLKKYPDLNSNLLVVNDGSRDRTGAILDELAREYPALIVVHKPNGGHGDALMKGYREAISRQAKFVFQTDSDDQFDPEDFSKLWEQRHQSKFILGRRLVRHDAFHRLVITRIVRLLNLVLFGKYLVDANIPFRLIEGKYLGALMSVLPSDVFAPNIFLSVLAALDGQKLMSIPVTHKDRETGVVSIVKWKLIKVCFRSARELFDFRVSLGEKLRKIREYQG